MVIRLFGRYFYSLFRYGAHEKARSFMISNDEFGAPMYESDKPYFSQKGEKIKWKRIINVESSK